MNDFSNNYNYIPLTVIQQILDAKLDLDIQTLALQLLVRTAGNTITLSKEQFILVAGKRCWNSAKGHLTALKDAGLIHYSTNQQIYITWLQPDGQAYPPFAHLIQSAQSPNIGTLGEPPIRSQENVNTENAEQRTNQSPNIGNYGKTPITTDWSKEGDPIYKTTSSSVGKYLNLLNSFGVVQEGETDPERSFALLTDTTVGMDEELAQAIGEKVTFDAIVRHTFAWLHDSEAGKVNTVGALANRICQRWAAPPLRHRDYDHPLYQEYVYRPSIQTDWVALRADSEKMELDAAASENAEHENLASGETELVATESSLTVEQQETSIDKQNSPSLELVTIWTEALRQLQAQVPASTYTAWLQDTCAIEQKGDELIVAVPNSYVRDWLQNRLRPMIKRVLSSILGQPIGILFQVQPGGVAMMGAPA